MKGICNIFVAKINAHNDYNVNEKVFASTRSNRFAFDASPWLHRLFEQGRE